MSYSENCQQRIYPTAEDLERSKGSQEVLLWHTVDGVFQGWEDKLVNRAQGIRYATSERYGAPKLYQHHGNIYEAFYPPPMSIQMPSNIDYLCTNTKYEFMEEIESCQFLSVTIPKGTKPDDHLPVMVWIHGGAFLAGGIDTHAYNLELLASQENVIVVAVAYRLGALGFMRNEDGEFGNLGLLDQIEALRWIQRNISAFGGNPQQVTIFGESAGGYSVHHLMICKGVEQLFQRVIIQSSPMGVMKNRSHMTKRFLKAYNTLPVDVPLHDIKRKQAELLKKCKEKGLAKYMPFAPHYGIYPLPDEAHLDQAWKQAADHLDILIGANTREASIYGFDNKLVRSLYHRPVMRHVIEAIVRVASHKVFIDDSKAFAKKYGSGAGKMYYYECFWGENDHFVGACHGIDLPLIFGAEHFGDSPLLLNKDHAEIETYGSKLRHIWGHFAYTGDIQEMNIDQLITITKMT